MSNYKHVKSCVSIPTSTVQNLNIGRENFNFENRSIWLGGSDALTRWFFRRKKDAQTLFSAEFSPMCGNYFYPLLNLQEFKFCILFSNKKEKMNFAS